MKFVLGGSGHIAGVVNPPSKGKCWSSDKPTEGAFSAWITHATENPLVVAGLARLDQGARRKHGEGAQDRRREIKADRGRPW
jgi:poly(3-hydroxyalkanoate) synthetase